MRIGLIIIILCTVLQACDLLSWDLPYEDYLNFEETSGISLGRAAIYNTEIGINDRDEYYWAGSNDAGSGLFTYSTEDSIFSFTHISLDYQTAVHTSLNDTIVLVHNQPDEILIQLKLLDGGTIDEYHDMKQYLNNELGLVEIIAVNDVIRYDSLLLFTGGLKQALGGSRTYIFATTLSLKPLWVRTYITDSWGSSIVTSDDGTIYVCGTRKSHGYIFRTNLEGDQFSIADFVDLGRDSTSDLLYNDGRLYYTAVLKGYPFQTRVMSFSGTLNLIWYEDLETHSTQYPIFTTDRRDKDLVISFKNVGEIQLLKIESHSGQIIWCNSFESALDFRPRGIAQTPDDGFLVLAESEERIFKLIKTDGVGATRLHPYQSDCH